jgi:putative phosphoesterase
MKIAVLSDIHDNILNLNRALQLIKQHNCEAIIFCGDYCSSITFKILADFGLPVYAIFGNVDGAKYEIMKAIMENNFKVLQKDDLLEIELDGKKIAVCHKPAFAEGLAATGKYDVVFHGHTHKGRSGKVGKTLLANPGEVFGGGGKCTFGIYETKTGKFKIIEAK